jgi:hypothetical protein
MQKSITIIPILLAILSLPLIYGCEKGPTVISYGKPAIFAELIRDEQRDQTVQNVIHVNVGGTRLVPVVSINNDTLEVYSYRREEYTYLSEFRGDVSVNPGDECKLVVYHDEGQADAVITLPGDFEITALKGDSTLHQNEDLIVNWGSSEGAERYKLDIYLYYHYVDTSGASNIFRLDTVFYSVDSLIIPKERIFPPDVDFIEYGSGNIYIYSESGPRIGYTTEGNIAGDGVGYFIASNKASERIYFSIGNILIVYGPLDPFDPVISPTEQFKKHLEYLKTHDPNFIQLE